MIEEEEEREEADRCVYRGGATRTSGRLITRALGRRVASFVKKVLPTEGFISLAVWVSRVMRTRPRSQLKEQRTRHSSKRKAKIERHNSHREGRDNVDGNEEDSDSSGDGKTKKDSDTDLRAGTKNRNPSSSSLFLADRSLRRSFVSIHLLSHRFYYGEGQCSFCLSFSHVQVYIHNTPRELRFFFSLETAHPPTNTLLRSLGKEGQS